jgi:hypothetical protein
MTLLVSKAALARAKAIMRAEMEHARREEVLAMASGEGLLGAQVL